MKIFKNYRPSRGIRQGDPLSSYLFILCAKALSVHLLQAEQAGIIQSVPTSPKGPRLNHLFFADDSLLFCKDTHQDWQNLTEILEKYERALGQKLNRDKTSIFFSRNTSLEIESLLFSYPSSLWRRDMTSIWGSQLWWVGHESENSTPCMTGLKKGLMIGKSNSFPKRGRRYSSKR